MKHTNFRNIEAHFPRFSLLGAALLFAFSAIGCSRSAWIQSDGHEVPPREQVECVRQVQEYSKGEILEQELLEHRIEQCMLDKGYKRRPWWLMNDLHWH